MRDCVAKDGSYRALIYGVPDPQAGRERATHRAEPRGFHANEPARRRL